MCLMNKLVLSGRIIRWLLLLQEFNATIIDKLGKDNMVTDLFSRLSRNKDDEQVQDSFPDKRLFTISAHTL